MRQETTGLAVISGTKKRISLSRIGADLLKCWQLYVLFLPPLIYLILFKYVPMYGAQIAFKDYKFIEGITNSPWAGFPFSIILAVLLNYVRTERFKKAVQMVTYAPYFISAVVMVSMILQFLSPRVGIINVVRELIGLENVNFMGVPEFFKSIYVWSGIWQGTGYGAIIYLAALASIDPNLHEEAIVDGTNKLQRIWHIDIPGILPTAVILLILNTGQILNSGFEKILLMQNPMNMRTSEVIDTFVYQVGLASQTVNYSYPTAMGLFKSIISLTLLVIVNRIARELCNSSLW